MFRNGRRIGFARGHRFTVTGLACARRYRFTLRARDAHRRRSGRSRLFVTTSSCPPAAPQAGGDVRPPSAPGNLAAGTIQPASIELRWTPSSDNVGVAGYRLFLNGTQLPQTQTSTSFVFSGLTCATSYTLGAQAFDAAGNSSPVASLPAATAACPAPPAATCPVNPLQQVQKPNQLTVLDPANPCRTAVGRVTTTSVAHDGDCHLDVNVDPSYQGLLNAVNLSNSHGDLVTEVIPSHTLPIPTVGSSVSVFGTWVNDKATGWNELHPVWSFQLLSGSTGAC